MDKKRILERPQFVLHYRNIDSGEEGQVKVRVDDDKAATAFDVAEAKLKNDFGEEGMQFIEIMGLEELKPDTGYFYKGKNKKTMAFME